MHATSSAEVQKDSENTQESETLRITDTVTIWEHADGTTDKKSTHTEERTVSRNTEKNSEATKSKTDTTSTNIKTSDTASNFQKVDGLSVRSEDKVIEKKSSGGFWTGFKIATALFVLVAFLLVFMYLKK
jgi:cobalamin biosynthesis Mg chelatase CobN